MAALSRAVTLYTTPFCPGCLRAKLALQRFAVPYTERDVTADWDAYADLLHLTHGQPHVPTLRMPSGELLIDPAPLVLLGKLTALSDPAHDYNG